MSDVSSIDPEEVETPDPLKGSRSKIGLKHVTDAIDPDYVEEGDDNGS